jgi:c-di-GMP-binding flagellar brake protein YcgR
MDISGIKAGTKLELDIMDNGQREGPVLVSQFEACTEDRKAIIAAPIIEGNFYNLPDGTNMLVYFKVNGKGGVDLYTFEAVVTGREINGNLHLLKIEQTSDIKRIQRRFFYRLQCRLNLKYRKVSNSKNEEDFVKAMTCDISGGGAKILINEELEVGEIIECELFIEDDKSIGFISRIVRCEKNIGESHYKFTAGLEYTKIKDNDREMLVQYIFDEQRKLLKKGLIF